MIRWVQNQVWFPEIILFAFLALAGILPDFFIQGWLAALSAAPLALSAIFLRKYQYVAIALVIVAFGLQFTFQPTPMITNLLSVVLVFFVAAFGELRWALGYTACLALVKILLVVSSAFTSPLQTSIYGVALYSVDGRWVLAILATVINLITIAFAWLLGTWLVTQYNERRLQRERTAVDEKQIRLAIDIAEQNERMGIAKDLNLVSTQQLSSAIALTEGARYAAKLNPDVALRTLERLEVLLRETHTELQQQQDALSHGVSVAPAPPNIFDLDALMVQYRELGYTCALTHHGTIISLIDSAELSIYRIVFDALENVRKHAPLGTNVTVELTWQDGGLQLLVKDNGAETYRKQNDMSAVGVYNVNDDLQALTEAVDGVGIRIMRERAEIIGGSLEAKKVPGVGFTVNALFPNLSQVIKAQ